MSLSSPFRARLSAAAEHAPVPCAPATRVRAIPLRATPAPGRAGVVGAAGALRALAALAALAAVAALSGCGLDRVGVAGSQRPAPSTAPSTGAPSTGPVPSLVPGSVLQPSLGCPAGIGVLVLQRLAVRMARDYTAVVARCDSAAGSPPSGVFLVAGGGAAASVAQTLVRPAQQLQVSALTATASGVLVQAAGYSRADVPRCCPDVTVTLTWRTAGDRLVLVP